MISMGLTAERVADRWKVSRADQDAYALDSHRKAAAALAAGRFDEQIVPVPVQRVRWNGATKQVDEGHFAVDELVRTRHEPRTPREAQAGIQAGRQCDGRERESLSPTVPLRWS